MGEDKLKSAGEATAMERGSSCSDIFETAYGVQPAAWHLGGPSPVPGSDVFLCPLEGFVRTGHSQISIQQSRDGDEALSSGFGSI